MEKPGSKVVREVVRWAAPLGLAFVAAFVAVTTAAAIVVYCFVTWQA